MPDFVMEVGGEQVIIRVDGADLLYPILVRAEAAAASAEAIAGTFDAVVEEIDTLQDEQATQNENIGLLQGDVNTHGLQIASIVGRLDAWQVFWRGDVIVDHNGGIIRYPAFIIDRGAEGYRQVNPADYGLQYFSAPIGSSFDAKFHYLDVALLAPAQTAVSPVKSVGLAEVIEQSLGIVPLGLSYDNAFTNVSGAPAITRRDMGGPGSLSINKAGSLFDPNSLRGGGVNAFYLPRGAQIYSVISGAFVGTISNDENPECIELIGMCKILWTLSPAESGALILDRATGKLSVVNYIELNARLVSNPRGTTVLAEKWNGRFKLYLSFRDVSERIGFNLFSGSADMSSPDIIVYDPTATRVPVVNATLNGLGISHGYQSVAGGAVRLGLPLPQSRVQNSDAVYSWYMLSSQDNAFPLGQLFWWRFGSFVDRVTDFVHETRIDARLVKFTWRGRFPLDAIDFFLIGHEAPSGVTITVCGPSFNNSSVGALELHPNDYKPLPSAAILAARDAANVQRSEQMKTRVISSLQKPTRSHCVLFMDGQSLAAGQETWPSLSKVNFGGNKMLGTAPFAANYSGNTYPVFGGAAALQDLVAKTVNGGHNTLLSDGDVAALAPGDGAFGEPASIGWINAAKFYLNQQLMTANDARTFVTINGAVSGQHISQFLKPSGPLYGRTQDGITKVNAAAGAGNVAVCGAGWMQGEYDYNVGEGGTNRKSTYKASLNKLFDDWKTDILAITGQPYDFAKFVYQTGAQYTVDIDQDGNPGLAIGMAQLEVSLERPDSFMVGPTYQTTDKGGHLDSNGSRWYGNLLAKVYHRVVHLGQDWEPLRPTRIEQFGKYIIMDFHVPEPPLVFDRPYSGTSAVDIANYGFKVTDALGEIIIDRVQIIGKTQVKLTLRASGSGQVNVWYAHQSVGGQGMLRDSDTFEARDKYEYLAGSGMYAGANIPALVGKPYPLQNWCVAFFYPVGFGV